MTYNIEHPLHGCASKELRLKALRETLTISQLITLGKAIETAYLASNEMDIPMIKTENVSYLNSTSQHSNQYHNNRQNYSRKQPHPKSTQQFIQSCIYCGCSHAYGVCPALCKTCLKCNGRNLFANVCRSKQSQHQSNRNQINNIQDICPNTNIDDPSSEINNSLSNNRDAINTLSHDDIMIITMNMYSC